MIVDAGRGPVAVCVAGRPALSADDIGCWLKLGFGMGGTGSDLVSDAVSARRPYADDQSREAKSRKRAEGSLFDGVFRMTGLAGASSNDTLRSRPLAVEASSSTLVRPRVLSVSGGSSQRVSSTISFEAAASSPASHRSAHRL